MKRSSSSIASWAFAALMALVASGYVLLVWLTQPASPTDQPSGMQTVIVPEGVTFREVAVLLEHRRLIASRWAFTILAKFNSADRRIIPGEYELHGGLRPTEILSKLLNGTVVLHQVTIPEGFTAVQIAEALEQKGLAKAEEFLRLTRDRTFIRSLELDVPTLEGYLFPDTYRFPRFAPVQDIIATMVGGLWRVFGDEWRARAQELNLTVHQVLTLASVIEKESGVLEEQPLISGVFHNRLRRRIPLQSDPTVIYGLQHFDGNLRKRDLTTYSPYNTYRIRGLPPGPIANPGASAIRAALYPVKTPYLYFVSRNNGTHEFSSTLAEHNRAVTKYQRRLPRRTVTARSQS